MANATLFSLPLRHPPSRSRASWVMKSLPLQAQLDDFRVSRETCRYICIACTAATRHILYKLASTTEYRRVANLFAVSRTSVCRCVHDFCKAVIAILWPKFIKTPDRAKLSEMADYLEERFGIPQCVGAIDGSHIPILKPPQYQSDFHNRKGWLLHNFISSCGL